MSHRIRRMAEDISHRAMSTVQVYTGTLELLGWVRQWRTGAWRKRREWVDADGRRWAQDYEISDLDTRLLCSAGIVAMLETIDASGFSVRDEIELFTRAHLRTRERLGPLAMAHDLR